MGDAEQKTMQELLKMSIKYSDAESKPLKPSEIDPERKEFVQNAINEVLEEDDYKKLVIWTNKFLTFTHTDIFNEQQLEEISQVFEGINFLLEGMDVPIDFQKLGGLKHCLSLLRSQYSSVQWRAADTIANSVQNIPKNQYAIIEEKGFETLLYILKQTDVDVVMVKCLYALSGLLGGNTVGEKLFVDLKGVNKVTPLLLHENAKVRLKVALLLRKMVYSETVRFVTNKCEIARNCVTCLRMPHDGSHEVIADILLSLMQANESIRDECRKDTDLKTFLGSRKEELNQEDKEMYEDVVVMYDKIQLLL